MKNVVKSLSGVVCLLFALSGCRMFSPTFTYTPEMLEVREKALAGDVESMRQMATYHWPESSPHMSHEETCRWLQRASDAGDAMSSELLGWCYLIGDGVPQSRENAARQFYLAGCAYWNRWQYTAYEDFSYLSPYLFRPYSVPCDGWGYEEASRSVGNLNRAILLGNHNARMQKGVVYLQLVRWISTRVRAKATDENSNLKELKSEIGRFHIDAPSEESFLSGEMLLEELKSCDSGSMPGLYDAVVADICIGDCTNVADLVELAHSVADLSTTDTFDVQALPVPRKIVVYGSKSAGSDDWRGHVWFDSFAVFDANDVREYETAYQQLHEKDRRAYSVLRMAKALPRFHATLGADGVRQLYARIVREAKLSELEAEVVLSNYLDETDWWIERE